MNDVLRQIYHDAGSEGGYSSVAKLHRLARERGLKVSRKQVRDWLKSEVTYTLHFPARRRFKRNPVVASAVGELCQADLVDMQAFASENDGFKYLLTFIDVFSKMAFAVPIKSKHATEIIKALASIFLKFRPFMLQCDRGTEFTNTRVKQYLENMGVKLYFAYNQDIKASVVERFNRTLKSKMFKYFTARGSRRYVDVLEQLLRSYNNSYHRSIKMRPMDVPRSEPDEVFQNLYGFESERELIGTPPSEQPRFTVGQSVRVKYHVGPLDKGFYPNYEDKVYKITKVIKRHPRIVYQIADEQGRLLPRKVYAEDLQLVSPDTAFRIERIIGHRTRRGVKEVLVKWLNHDETHNSWIPEADVQNVSGI